MRRAVGMNQKDPVAKSAALADHHGEPALQRRRIDVTPEGLYDEFCARFPYDETQDQASAIEATLDDMAAGRPMDDMATTRTVSRATTSSKSF